MCKRNCIKDSVFIDNVITGTIVSGSITKELLSEDLKEEIEIGGNIIVPKNNLTATVEPTEDNYEGYSPGSLWYQNVINEDEELCAYAFVCTEINGNKATWARCVTGFGY